jgi:hypothetical protein
MRELILNEPSAQRRHSEQLIAPFNSTTSVSPLKFNMLIYTNPFSSHFFVSFQKDFDEEKQHSLVKRSSNMKRKCTNLETSQKEKLKYKGRI